MNINIDINAMVKIAERDSTEKNPYIVYGILWTYNRDSGLLSISNHETILRRLRYAGNGKRYITQFIDEVVWNDWAYGKVYGILIPLYVIDKTGNKIPIHYIHSELNDIQNDYSRYPILDEDDHQSKVTDAINAMSFKEIKYVTGIKARSWLEFWGKFRFDNMANDNLNNYIQAYS